MTSTEVARWADKAMWKAEDAEAKNGTTAVLVSANTDPLGEIWALNQTYVGKTVTNLSTVTDENRRGILADIKSTVLKMPLEVIRLHFHLKGVHRGITHQMVRQRTAAFAQESMRFAVKEDLAEAVALPPSLRETWDFEALRLEDLHARTVTGLRTPDPLSTSDDDQKWLAEHADNLRKEVLAQGGPQAHRLKWDEAVRHLSETYLELINDGMPAEEARGLTPTNTLTNLHYITNLRSFYDTMGMRVSDQAQYEWREVIMAMAMAMRQFGKRNYYKKPDGYGGFTETSSEWQFVELTNAILPIDFALGHRGFGSPFDRASRIGERVDAFAAMGVPSSRWLEGAPEFNIPALRPEEWLMDPNSARINGEQEFDIFGQRVTKGTGWHWTKEHGGILYNDGPRGRQWANLHDGPSFDVNDVITKKEESNV